MLVNNLDYKIYSFDIFDTLVTRVFLKPVDLFYELGHILKNEKIINVNPEKFKQDRIDAEAKARKNTNLEDITFNEIYEYLYDYKNLELIKKKEIELEIKAAVPIRENIEILNQYLSLGKKVIIISDMYLDKCVLKEILLKVGVNLKGVDIYVSSQYGLTKRTGNLFKKICETNGILFNEILHIGNDKKADYIGAKINNIDCFLYTGWLSNKYEYSDQIHSTLGVGRAMRLSQEKNALKILTANVISPLIYDFVYFILEKAIKENIKKLIFLSRDGQIFYKIAKSIIKNKNMKLDINYIYASRKLWSYPSILKFDLNNIKWVVQDASSKHVGDFIKRLEIEDFKEKIYNFFGSDRELNLLDLELFVEEFKNTELEKFILEKSKIYREESILYFQSFGMIEEEITIVDVGWRLNMQKYLKKIISTINEKINVRGFYLGVNKGHTDLEEVGDVFAYIRHSQAKVESVFVNDSMFKTPSIMIMEHIFCCSDHPTVKRYSSNFNRIIFDEKLDERFIEDVTHIHNIAVLYADLRNEFLTLSNIDIENLYNALKFIYFPSLNEVYSLHNFELNKDILHAKELSRAVVTPINSFSDLKRSDWFYGSYAISNYFFKFIFSPLIFLKYLRYKV